MGLCESSPSYSYATSDRAWAQATRVREPVRPRVVRESPTPTRVLVGAPLGSDPYGTRRTPVGAEMPRDAVVRPSELARHRSRADAWIAVRGRVYDVTRFLTRHPGGVSAIEPLLGTDATVHFNGAHSYINAEASLSVRVGRV